MPVLVLVGEAVARAVPSDVIVVVVESVWGCDIAGSANDEAVELGEVTDAACSAELLLLLESSSNK